MSNANPRLSSTRGHSQALHFSYEKAGRTLTNQPVPWNAEAVLIEAIVRLPSVTPESRQEFTLLGADDVKVVAEQVRACEGTDQARVFFRIAAPARTGHFDVRWRERSLGQITVPVIQEPDYMNSVRFEHPTVQIRLRDEMWACQAFVAAQTRELIASVEVSSPHSLAPLADKDVAIEVVASGGQVVSRHALRLSGRQLLGRTALLVTPIRKPRACGPFSVRWLVGEEVRGIEAMRSLSRTMLMKSLRLSATRIYQEGVDGPLPLARFAPESLDGIARLGPVFLVSTGVEEVAADAEFTVRVIDQDRNTLFEMPEQRLVLRGGPTVVAPGTLACADLASVRAFELWAGPQRLGSLPLGPMPTASFTGEGGFVGGGDDFDWSPAAEEQLRQRLGKLFDGT